MSPVTTEGRDDGELLDAIANRDRDALEEFYHKYAGGVYSLAMYMLRSPEAAEEVTQDAFFNV